MANVALNGGQATVKGQGMLMLNKFNPERIIKVNIKPWTI